MTTNIYWPIYLNIEKEIKDLMFNIHMDDSQLQVYSSKIIDLILRSAAEIESLAKELYTLNGGTKTGNIKYDYDALVYLNSKWKLEEKVFIISSFNCFFSNRELKPFVLSEAKTGKPSELTYSWNNAYQNLKHDRANSLPFGSVKYLFDIAAALYALNIYYRDLTFDLGKDQNGAGFDSGLGSSIFSIKLHTQSSIGLLGNTSYNKNQDYDQCVYLTRPKEDKYLLSQQVSSDFNAQLQQAKIDLVMTKVNKMLHAGEIANDNVEELTNEVQRIVNDEMKKEMPSDSIKQQIQNFDKTAIQNLEYEAVLNKSQY